MSRPSKDSFSNQSIVDALGRVTLPGDDVDAFIDALSQRHGSVLRMRRQSLDEPLPFETESVDWYSLGRRLQQTTDRPSRHLRYAAGDYYLQDAGSLLALAACGADDDDTVQGLSVCDLCAAPGGKASGLLEAIGPTGFLLANEPIRSRIAPLAFNLARTGSDRYAISAADPEQLADTLPGQFDLVVVDAPCSGQALMGRGKQTASALSEKQIQHSAARQERILDAAVRLLRPGGRLVYSTCTFAEAENEAQVERLVTAGQVTPLLLSRLADFASGEGTYRLWPHQHQCAGSFAASMIAADTDQEHIEAESLPILRERKKDKRKRDRDKDEERVMKAIDLDQWYHGLAGSEIFKMTDSVLYSWPSDVPAWVAKIAVDGPELAHRTGNTWKPAHAAALRRETQCLAQESFDVDGPTAKQFLSGSPVPCDSKGWQVVNFHKRPLGWIKASNGTGKNQLPSAARFSGLLDD